jgi:ADP-ribose pyrophosphatase
MTETTEIIGTGNWLELVRQGRWEFVRRNRGHAVIAIIAVTDADEIVIVEQYRPAVGASCFELPAGLVGDDAGQEGEDLLPAAMRELEEETGYAARHWQLLYAGASSTGLTTEICTLFLAKGLRKVAIGGGVEGENITVHLVPLASAPDWLRNQQQAGAVIDIKLWGALSSGVIS